MVLRGNKEVGKMAEYIKTLKEDNGDITYPVTKSGAVLLNNGSDLETELANYVTAEDIASTADVEHPITTSLIADGAVTAQKIAYSTYGRFARDNEGGSQAYTANTQAIALLPHSITPESGCTYSNGTITITQPGWWLITGGGRCFGGGTAGYGSIRVSVNGENATVANGTGYANSSYMTTFNSSLAWTGYLAAGDQVTLRIQPSASMTNNTAAQQHLEGVCLMPS